MARSLVLTLYIAYVFTRSGLNLFTTCTLSLKLATLVNLYAISYLALTDAGSVSPGISNLNNCLFAVAKRKALDREFH